MSNAVHVVVLTALLAPSAYLSYQLRAARQTVADAPLHSVEREEFVRAGRWLHAFYRADDGLVRPAGLCSGPDGEPDFDGIAAWLLDVYQEARRNGASEEEARNAVTTRIHATDEWRRKHQ